MKKISFFVCVLFISLFTTVACKHRSYGSSRQMSSGDSHFDFIPKGQNPDCVAWKFYLYTSMYGIVHQGSIRIVADMQMKYLDDNKMRGKYLSHYIDIYHILPPETAKLIIDTIIEKEGGHCSREVLYEIPSCVLLPDPDGGRRQRGGRPVYAAGSEAEIEYDHFSKSTGLPMSDELVRKYGDFFKGHIAPFPNTKARPAVMTWPLPSSDVGDGFFLTYYNNSFGLCMLEKYAEYFKNKNIYDIKNYFYWENGFEFKVDPKSVEVFIRESDKISEKYKKSSP